jgi:hypothetical protein
MEVSIGHALISESLYLGFRECGEHVQTQTRMILHSIVLGEGKPFVITWLLGMADNWKTLGTQWSESGFQTHLLDQRNHGRSFHEDGFDYNDMAQDVAD